MASAVTHKTRPLMPGGALMLGSEQDCYGGCGDRQAGGAAAAALAAQPQARGSINDVLSQGVR
jgi:hypothetical protein